MVLNKKIVFSISLCKPHVLRSSSTRVLALTNSQPIRLQDSLEEYLLIEWLDFSVFGPVQLGEEGSYDLATVSMSIGKHVNSS